MMWSDLFQMALGIPQSVWPSSEVSEGSDVTLTCSSNANPTLNYTWFKMDGDSCLEMVTQAELQFNVSHTGNSGKYFCVVSNKHGRQNSTILSLKVKGKYNNIL